MTGFDCKKQTQRTKDYWMPQVKNIHVSLFPKFLHTKLFLFRGIKLSRLLPQTSPTLLGAKHCLIKKKVLAILEAVTRGVL